MHFRPYQREYRTLAKTITLNMRVAIPATSMVKARCGSNGMRHFWRLSSDGSIDLRQESRMALPSLARLSNLPIMIERHPSGFIEPCPSTAAGHHLGSPCCAGHCIGLPVPLGPAILSRWAPSHAKAFTADRSGRRLSRPQKRARKPIGSPSRRETSACSAFGTGHSHRPRLAMPDDEYHFGTEMSV